MIERVWECVPLPLCVCVCVFSSLFVCLCVCFCPVRSFVAGAINPPPPVLCSCCALICWYTLSVISLYAYSACWREILTLSTRRSLLFGTAVLLHIRCHAQRVNSSMHSHLSDVAVALPSDADWEKRHLEWKKAASTKSLELTQPFWCICFTEILTSSLVCDSLRTG